MCDKKEGKWRIVELTNGDFPYAVERNSPFSDGESFWVHYGYESSLKEAHKRLKKERDNHEAEVNKIVVHTE